MIVSGEFIVGGKGDVEQGVVARQFVKQLALEVIGFGEVDTDKLVFLLGDVVLLFTKMVRQRL